MKLQDIGEFGFIERISAGGLIRPESIVKGIGDDAAVIRSPAGEVLLVTTDLLVERVHFLRRATSGFNLGHKALAVNLSDIAAMGGTAREAFVSIAVPENCDVEYLDDLYRGMHHLAARHRVNILGGDTTGSLTDLVINVAVVGTAAESEVLYRSGARAGDVICVTGDIGDSRAGLHLILNDPAAETPDLQALLEAHLLPQPCLEEGRFLATCGAVRSAIDLSDGLSSDLGHILSCSRVGARIEDRRLPLSDNLKVFCRRFGFDPVGYALAGGEDYSLLCTVAPEAADGVVSEYARRFGHPLYTIGEITPGGGFERIGEDGRIRRVASSGWDHFRSRRTTREP
jgi:thiamine-monophosphate kinase